jgi:hypothetical protein
VTARERLRGARWILGVGTVSSAVAWAAVSAVLLLLVVAGIDVVVPLSLSLRQAGLALAMLVALVAAGITLARARGVLHEESVALWLEERLPELRYSLVTLLAPVGASSAQLERVVAGTHWRAPIERALLRAVGVPLLLLASALLVTRALPAGSTRRAFAPAPGDALARTPVDARNRSALETIVATVTTPAYSGLAPVTLEQPATITALAGSRLVIEGRRTAAQVSAGLDSQRVAVVADADRWRSTLTMPPRAAALHFADGIRERWVVVDPRADSVPVVTLTHPARDSVLRTPIGRIPIVADMRDDFGLAECWFELIISSGGGEQFRFRTLALGRMNGGNARSLTLRTTLVLDSLRLEPGDVLHLRAMARDRNTASGPGIGSSDTRTLRVLRAGEGDSVAVEGAPPPAADSSLLSQRMLILLTEGLVRKRRSLAHERFVDESRRIAGDQVRLRRRVADVIFARLGGDASGEEQSEAQETKRGGMTPEQLLQAAEAATGGADKILDFSEDESPVVATNRPLLEAYQAMWDASRSLEIGEPERALPPMHRALEAIERARQAERLYLRGRPPVVVVDLARVRLSGSRQGVSASARTPRPPDSHAAGRLHRLERALSLLAGRHETQRDAAIDSLLLLRVDALADAPALAASLGTAIDALRAGRDATEALATARRGLGEALVVMHGPSAWGSAW